MKDVPRNLKQYFLCLFVRGPRWDDVTGPEAANLMPRHLAFLRAQVESKRCVFTGPVTDGGRIVSFSILQAASQAEAQQSTEQDPAVRSGHLAVELHPTFLPALDSVVVQF